MKLLSVFLGLELVQCVVGFEYVHPPGISDRHTCSGVSSTDISAACVSKCWDNSKYVSSCTGANETMCLCQDADFQNVGSAAHEGNMS